jgi:hypothetical protein
MLRTWEAGWIMDKARRWRVKQANQKKNFMGKEGVSFGTNMTPDDESSDGGSTVKMELELATAVEFFHARKFGMKNAKHAALKVHGSGSVKKQRTPVKTGMQGVLKTLDNEEMEEIMKLAKTEPREPMEVVTKDTGATLKLEPPT